MTSHQRQLHFISCIDWLDQTWRISGEPETGPVRWCDIHQLGERAQLAEKGLMDAMFTADFYTYRANLGLEPITVLATLAGMTKHIGVIASVSTTYNEPYNIARMFGSLDQISKGRAGWNMVTTAIGTVAENYSQEAHLEHDTRYERAHELVSIVDQLWQSWTTTSDKSDIHSINHHGEWFNVQGPLNIPQSPQGHPVRMQAGSSQAGRNFGAKWAEIIFTAQPVLAIAQDFYSDVKTRMTSFGRAPNELNIMPGLMPIVAETEEEAKAHLAKIQARSEASVFRISELVGVDLSKLAPDQPIPLELLPESGSTNGMRGRADLYLDMIRRYHLSPKQVMSQGAHLAHAGTPEQMADLITEWFLNYGCDGFTLMWPSIEANILFVERVIPILQARGLYRLRYEGTTLREHFNLPFPQPLIQD